ncbi:MAG TPA: signal peptide peptidase SppA [Candidatus Limnocylindria bacterium]|nr:signal peptide peptidase SppA [Candidatus Limnocylindria bacterium]
MRRIAVVLACWLAGSGCVLVVSSPLGLLSRDRPPLEEVVVDGEGKDKVLLIDVAGMITDTPSRRALGLVEEDSTLARIEAELAAAKEDDRIRAVVVYVRSPGGGVTASDDVYRAVRRFKDERKVPVVAALGGVAASGGYYVACAADRIVAHPTAVTGSIGVIMVNLNLDGLLGKIGVRDATVKAGRYKNLMSPLKPLDPEDHAIVQRIVDSLHAHFKDVVRDARGLDDARLAAVSDGRVFDAPTAHALGLVDEVGDLHAAIDAAKKAAGIEEAKVIRYRRAGESADTLHARWQGGPDVQALDIEGELLRAAGPRFLYLWDPMRAE